MDKLVCVDDFKKEAFRKLGKSAREFYFSGADDEITINANVDAFSSLLIRPHMLRDVSNRNITTTVLGKPLQVPFGISPSAFQRLAHPDGECGSAKAAEKVGGIMVLSIFGNSSYEELQAAAPNGRKWCQFYMHKDRDLTRALISRAEKAGFEAMVCTVDCQYVGNRRVSTRNPLQFPSHLRLPNQAVPESATKNKDGINLSRAHDIFDHGITWEGIEWLKKVSTLPLIVKGIQTVEDAVKAVECGCDAVWVSNHGGRQIDTVPTTISILPEIVAAVGEQVDVYVDGGVRRGSDIFKCLALGAKMAFVGRPAIWGLAVDGTRGVTRVMEILKEELDLTMALSGVNDVKNLTPQYVEWRDRIAKL